MEDDMKKDLVENEAGVGVDERPPPYNTVVAPPTGEQEQQFATAFPQQPNDASVYPLPSAGVQQIANVRETTTQPTTAEVFAAEECFAECVRFWWCRPIGWQAKKELARARALYIAGDYEGAQAAARCANAWSVGGLIAGIVLCVVVGVSVYLIVTQIYDY